MKRILYLLILITGFANAQIVNIPDANFKAKLLSSSIFNTVAYGNGGYVKIDQNDDGEIQETEALVIDSLNVSFSSIIDFNGISSFSNLKKINCSNNQINNLNVSNLALLQELYCSNNCMGTLSVSGLSNLKILDANSICVNNFNLIGLSSLEYLSCISNSLTLLDVSELVSLKTLNCSNNNITSLTVSGLVDLETLNCENNLSLTSLNINSLPSLAYLFVAATNIGSLDLTTFTSLINVDCNLANLNTLLIDNLTNLYSLSCAENSLSNLDLGSMPALQILQCGGNPFTTIDLSETPNITRFECSSSFINNIDLSNLTNLNEFTSYNGQFEELDFSSNPNLSLLVLNTNIQLKRLFLKNGTIQNFDNPGLAECINLEFICVDESEISQIQNFINAGDLTNVSLNSYCFFTPGGNYNTIVGQVQFDEDNNGCDVNDGGLQNVRINIADSTLIGATFTNANGGYTFYSQALNHQLFVATENPTWFTVSPELASVSFDEINNNQALQNFCITPNGLHPDLEIVITPTVPARPGFDATYKIVYRNKGNQTLSQQYGINFFYNQNLMEYVSASVIPSQMVAGGISWDYVNLQPFESREIVFTLNINAPTEDINPVNNGDVLTFTTSIMPQAGDENTSDNTFLLNQIVVGSYDPNDITCLEGDIVSPSEIGEYLHYNIRFENTGTFYAENIVVKTEINPTEFDINTLQLLNASHTVDARIRGNIVEFIFKEIYLQTGGHGNVLLKVKTKPSLQIGDLVKNKANIYFDYNFPIVTNDAETVFQSLSNPDFEIDNSVKIYPNPSNALVNIKSDFNIKSIQLYDVQGRILQTNIVEENTTSLDITSKAKGIYFLKVITDKGIKVEKLVKE